MDLLRAGTPHPDPLPSQVGPARLVHSLVPISGKPEIGGEREKKQTAKRQRPVFSDAGASSFLFLPPSNPRERSAVRRTVKSIRTAAVGLRGLPARAACDGEPRCEQCRHARAQRRSTGGDFGPWDRASGRKGHCPDPADFAAFLSHPSSHRRQPHLVGADGDPWPPGDGLRGTSAGAAPPGFGQSPSPGPLGCSINRRL